MTQETGMAVAGHRTWYRLENYSTTYNEGGVAHQCREVGGGEGGGGSGGTEEVGGKASSNKSICPGFVGTPT